MKELSIEEKAKAYDEALEIARQYWNDKAMPIGTNFKLERMFPELRESEDERIRKELIAMVKLSCTNGDDVDKKIAWLEKQGEQKPAKWSKEDEDYYDTIIAKLEVTQDDAALTDNQMNFLKSLKNRVQPKQDWSEEDEQMMAAIEHHLNNCGTSITSILWFKSLKDRYAWKPSEEQVRAIDVVRGISNRYSNDTLKALESLYQDLKKLREE